MTRQDLRTNEQELIYRATHPDFKGLLGGAKSILVCRSGATVLVPLTELTPAEFTDRLTYARRKLAEGRI